MIGRFIENPCEDSLTAAVFSHLLHLPFEAFWGILRNSCYTDELPENPGEPLRVDSWPVWSAKETTNTTYVEPDFFIRFAGFDLIVEAKRWDYGTQSPEQLQRELIAYTNEYGEERKEVKLLALGGIHGTLDDTLSYSWAPIKTASDAEVGEPHKFVCPVHMCLWSRLLAQCQRMELELKRLEYPTSQNHAHRRILGDLIGLFTCHGFQTGIWYKETLCFRPRLSAGLETSRRIFSSIHKHFQNL